MALDTPQIGTRSKLSSRVNDLIVEFSTPSSNFRVFFEANVIPDANVRIPGQHSIVNPHPGLVAFQIAEEQHRIALGKGASKNTSKRRRGDKRSAKAIYRNIRVGFETIRSPQRKSR